MCNETFTLSSSNAFTCRHVVSLQDFNVYSSKYVIQALQTEEEIESIKNDLCCVSEPAAFILSGGMGRR